MYRSNRYNYYSEGSHGNQKTCLKDNLPGDLDNSGRVDVVDLGYFAQRWMDDTCEPNNWCGLADLTGVMGSTGSPGQVDEDDLLILAENQTYIRKLKTS